MKVITAKASRWACKSPPAPQLTDGWMSKFDAGIKGDTTIFLNKLVQINNLAWKKRFFNSVSRHKNSQRKRKTHLRMVYQIYWYRIDRELPRPCRPRPRPARYKLSVVSGLVATVYTRLATVRGNNFMNV